MLSGSWLNIRRSGFLMLALSIITFLFLPSDSLAVCGHERPFQPGTLTWPVTGEVTSAWTLDCVSDRGHRGVDIASEPEQPVLAAASGTVSFTGFTPAEGGSLTLSITHEGDVRSTYLHLADISVVEGEVVSQGQRVGSSDGSPIHFGLKRSADRDIYYDPLLFLRESPEPQTGFTGADNAALTTARADPRVVAPAAQPQPKPVELPHPAAETGTYFAMETRLSPIEVLNLRAKTAPVAAIDLAPTADLVFKTRIDLAAFAGPALPAPWPPSSIQAGISDTTRISMSSTARAAFDHASTADNRAHRSRLDSGFTATGAVTLLLGTLLILAPLFSTLALGREGRAEGVPAT